MNEQLLCLLRLKWAVQYGMTATSNLYDEQLGNLGLFTQQDQNSQPEPTWIWPLAG